MTEGGGGVSWRTVRSWLGQHAGILLVLLVGLYLLGFFLYHTVAPVDALLWQGTARYAVGEACTLLIEYPAQVPLTSPDEPGYPLTARLWYDAGASSVVPDDAIACAPGIASSVYAVLYGPLGEGLEFTDEAGNPVPPAAELALAQTESTAIPAQLYVRRAPSANLKPVVLSIQAQGFFEGGSSVFLETMLESAPPPTIHPETERASRWRSFWNVLFNPGPLQWMFTAVAGIVGVWEVYKNLQQQREERQEKAAERRRVQRERIETLRTETSPERAFHAYLALMAEFEDEPEMQEELRNAFHADWLPYLRQQLGRYLRAGQFRDAQEFVAQMEWEWRQGASEGTYGAVETLIRHLREPRTTASRDVLRQVLDGFRGAGLEATDPVTDWLIRLQPDLNAVRDVMFKEGRAGGRYLLLKWGEWNKDVWRSLRDWEQEELPPVRQRGKFAGLWARDRGESEVIHRATRHLGLDFNPFGPEKAEQDPRLPDLFYRLSPVWEEVTAPQPSILLAPPGAGRSALAWMIRYESGLIGSSVENVFPVFVPVYACPSPEELAQTLQSSIAAALVRALAADPYALLGLGQAEQYSLADLLLHSAGGLAPLLRQLRAAGLSSSDPDGQLLQEALAIVARSRETWEGAMHWDIPRFHPYGRDHTFLLVDVSPLDANATGVLLESLFGRWLPSLAPRHVVPKVFLSTEPDGCPVTPVSVHWDEASLGEMLSHRLQRAGLVLQEGQPMLHGWIDGLDNPDAVLIEQAAGSPSRLVGLGNRLMRRIAQLKPLAREEFLTITSLRTRDDT